MAELRSFEGPGDTRERLAEFAARDRDAKAQELAAHSENRDFVQVYPKGWRRFREMLKDNPSAARLYAFFAEHIDASAGVVCVSQDLLADEMDMAVITVRRLTKWLEDANAIVRIRVGAGVYAYALDPTEVWRSWDKGKATAVFNTRTLVKKADKANGEVRRKLTVMVKEASQDAEADDVN